MTEEAEGEDDDEADPLHGIRRAHEHPGQHGMDAIPRAIAQWDPISALVAAVRHLTENVPSSGSWQLDHPEIAMVLWCLIIIGVAIPLALREVQPDAGGLIRGLH